MGRVNLLPRDLRRPQESPAWRLGTILMPVATAAYVATALTMALGAQHRVSAAITTAQDRLQTLAPDVKASNELGARKRKLLLVHSVSEQISADQRSWADDLARFTLAMSPELGQQVKLNSLTLRAVTPAAAAPGQTDAAGSAPGVVPPFDGKRITRSVQVSGVAASAAAVAGFIRTYSRGEFGITFNNATESDGTYNFSATVGMTDPAPTGAATTDSATSPAGSDAAPDAAGSTP